MLSWVCFLFLLSPVSAESAWLLWEHWVEFRHPLPEEKDEKGMVKGFRRTSDSWSLENAFETRDQCVSQLSNARDHIRQTEEWGQQDLKPNERTKFIIPP